MKITRYLFKTDDAAHIKFIDMNKGNGVFATERLERGTALPYYGRRLESPPLAAAGNRYVVEVVHNKLYIDGTQENGLASYVNEPDPGKRPNARLQLSRYGRPNQTSGAYAHVVLIKRVNPGTEITMCYGRSYDRRHYGYYYGLTRSFT